MTLIQMINDRDQKRQSKADKKQTDRGKEFK